MRCSRVRWLAGLVFAGLLSAGQAMAQEPAAPPAPLGDLQLVEHKDGLNEAAAAAHESCCRWYNHIGLFGDFLYLSPRGLDVPFARLVDGCGVDAISRGGPVLAQPDYSPGFRVGGCYGIDECSCLMASFTRFESHTNASLTAGPNDVIQGLVTMPNQSCAASIGANGPAATARFDVDFTLVDLDYKHLILARNGFSLDWYVGLRYGNTSQDLTVNIPVLQATRVDSTIEFEGVGPRLGLEGEKITCNGLLFYGHAGADFLAGNFRSHFHQVNDFVGDIGDVHYDNDRIVTILELELGIGWQSQSGHFRVQAGYLLNGWFNTVNTADFISAVATNNFITNNHNLTNSYSFDGFVARMAFHF